MAASPPPEGSKEWQTFPNKMLSTIEDFKDRIEAVLQKAPRVVPAAARAGTRSVSADFRDVGIPVPCSVTK